MKVKIHSHTLSRILLLFTGIDVTYVKIVQVNRNLETEKQIKFSGTAKHSSSNEGSLKSMLQVLFSIFHALFFCQDCSNSAQRFIWTPTHNWAEWYHNWMIRFNGLIHLWELGEDAYWRQGVYSGRQCRLFSLVFIIYATLVLYFECHLSTSWVSGKNS